MTNWSAPDGSPVLNCIINLTLYNPNKMQSADRPDGRCIDLLLVILFVVCMLIACLPRPL
jgi:hypothetical protein